MELWHALNRGVDGRKIFSDDRDRVRFVHNLYAFNDAAPADPNIGNRVKSMDIGSPYIEPWQREQLVDIHGWCLMENHYHLLLSEIREGGLALFLRKLNVGYVRSFNEKHKRRGVLFENRTKKILVSNDAHFNYLLHYIHLNPLDYLEGARNWRIRDHGSIADTETALNYLAGYRWSSYLDYLGQRNFPSLITTSLFKDSFGDYGTSIRDYLLDAEYDLADLKLE